MEEEMEENLVDREEWDLTRDKLREAFGDSSSSSSSESESDDGESISLLSVCSTTAPLNLSVLYTL